MRCVDFHVLYGRIATRQDTLPFLLLRFDVCGLICLFLCPKKFSMDHFWSTITIQELLVRQNRDLDAVAVYFSNEVAILLLLPLIVFLILISMQPKHRGRLLFSDYFSYQKPTKFGFLEQYLSLPISLIIWSIISVIGIMYFIQEPLRVIWSAKSFFFAILPIMYFFWLQLATSVASFITGVTVFKRPILITTSQMFFIIVLLLSVAAVIQMAYPMSKQIVYFSFIAFASIVILQRVIKSIWICLMNRISLYYLILYLCALEIAPLVFIYRKVALFESD